MSTELLIDDFITAHRLSTDFRNVARLHYLPLAKWLLQQHRPQGTLFLGINGSQGSGKSTLADFLQRILEQQGLTAASLSIDDLYLTRAQRINLAETVHPLLLTRGVPGTHDTTMGIDLLDQLSRLTHGQALRLPRFDKAIDDRQPEPNWPVVLGPVDVVILEGWCVGSLPQQDRALREPVNKLEADEDPGGIWRQYVNTRLAEDYQTLFSKIHKLVVLKAPSFDCVYQWRLEQEHKLAEDMGKPIMSDDEVLRFIQHYQRLTTHNLNTLPAKADVLFELDETRQFVGAYYRQ